MIFSEKKNDLINLSSSSSLIENEKNTMKCDSKLTACSIGWIKERINKLKIQNFI